MFLKMKLLARNILWCLHFIKVLTNFDIFNCDRINYKHFGESQFRISLFQYIEALTKEKKTYIKIKLNHTAKGMQGK